MSINVAVAMSVYVNDHVDFFKSAVQSLLVQDDVEIIIYIQVDGELSGDFNSFLNKLSLKDNINVIFNSDNLGLATRLNQIIDMCLKDNIEFLARMDADDICNPTRFKKQVEFLINNPDIAVVGSDVQEISDNGKDLFYKKMDALHDDLSKNIIRKCPFNHPSVMFRMSIFAEGFRYKSELMNTQDYYLWVDLLAAGKRFANINDPLLKFRVNDTFHSRRGFKKAMNDLNSRVYAFKKLDVLTFGNIIHTINLFMLRLAPSFIKKWAYKNLR